MKFLSRKYTGKFPHADCHKKKRSAVHPSSRLSKNQVRESATYKCVTSATAEYNPYRADERSQ